MLVQETAVLSGSFSFSLSAAPVAGAYMLECRASAPALTFSQAPIFYVQKPVSLSLAPVSKAIYKNYYNQLILSSTAGGTFSYKMATPSGVQTNSVTMPFGGTTNKILVPITESGSYSLVDASSRCGPGHVSGVASVTILPQSEAIIFPRMPNTLDGAYCTGQSYLVSMQTVGSFRSDNVFTAYIADSVGRVFRSLPIAPNKEFSSDGLYIFLPNDLPDGDRFVFRVGSSNPAHMSASLVDPRSSESVNFMVRHVPTATLTGTLAIFKGDSARVSVALTGTPPWRVTYPGQVGPLSYGIDQSPYVLAVKPDTTIRFQLTSVYNLQCGRGTVSGTTQIIVSVLLSTEPALPLTVRVFPNPTSAGLQIEGDWPTGSPVAFVLTTATGRQVHESVNTPAGGRLSHRIDLSGQPTGVYILTAEADGRRSQFKVLKQ
ncbi:T9SS type A sorting domain-containing protein [Fibrella sp. HMF5335]|uniref:T9SS type A sorting domain-containing protein n=1 Tax=Fibrella rubiginis TaxID=2817060 RepID=A0A939GBE2_9BACT|nr:T9SS type A sorting domain-containing protein [Fibrella rubiginis]MBO0935266.1 T9SS type A sorting domain-containing protein [Fibrella rubiginis]